MDVVGLIGTNRGMAGFSMVPWIVAAVAKLVNLIAESIYGAVGHYTLFIVSLVFTHWGAHTCSHCARLYFFSRLTHLLQVFSACSRGRCSSPLSWAKRQPRLRLLPQAQAARPTQLVVPTHRRRPVVLSLWQTRTRYWGGYLCSVDCWARLSSLRRGKALKEFDRLGAVGGSMNRSTAISATSDADKS